jgi:hypothetical protein
MKLYHGSTLHPWGKLTQSGGSLPSGGARVMERMVCAPRLPLLPLPFAAIDDSAHGVGIRGGANLRPCAIPQVGIRSAPIQS